MRRQGKHVEAGPIASLTLFAIWLVGLIQIIKWVIEGLS